MSNYFAFIDESGNSDQERFFGLGLLLIDDEIGDFYDAMKPQYEKILINSRNIKATKINQLRTENKIEEMSQIASSSQDFELKFKYINFSNNHLYKELIDKYFSFPNVRFCSLVIDRTEFVNNAKIEPWDAYIHQAAMLLSNNIKNIQPCNVCILADDLSRPKKIRKSFEKSLNDSIVYRLRKNGINASISGITRLESHASLMIQMVDVLLGSVMYDYKEQAGIISETLKQRQGIILDKIHTILNTKTLAQNITFHKPNYFSVWPLKK